MPLGEHNWERFFQQQAESKEDAVEKENNNEKFSENVDTKQEKEESSKKSVKVIMPEEAHGIALSLLDNEDFMKKLKTFAGELIVHKENLTRIDSIIDETDDKALLKLYGMTRDHFEDLLNGNLISFELSPDGPALAIYFKRVTGEPAIRPIDDSKLAEMLNIMFKVLPALAPEKLQSDIKVK